MLLRISNHSKRIAAILSQYRTPPQIAFGAALGVVLGLIPKDNFVFLSLVVALALLRVNQLVGCIVAGSLGLLSGWFEPITHVLGSMLLSQSIAEATIQRLFEYPLFAWTCIDNTLVCGGLILGLMSIPPTYLACWWSLTRAQDQRESHDLIQVANEAFRYRKSVLDQTALRRERPTQELRLVSKEDLVQADVFVPTPSSSKLKTKSSQNDETSKLHGSDRILRETVIEIVRYRRPVSLDSGGKQRTRIPDPSIIPLNTGTNMAAANMPLAQSIDGKNGRGDPSPIPVMGHMAAVTVDTGHSNFYPNNREESLKYLLSHINNVRESNRKPSGKSA